ncbi:unnamed protein product [Diatraea saccharalis]|uniref:Uncharacterized protein n=1 Tax=Diatraea saccharalis TaxID=40085 RepID=A0A9N9QSV7_9NEOP|nr:unnamed protein product [Diatraea saccharalis]
MNETVKRRRIERGEGNVDLPFLERQVVEKRAERDEQARRDLAFARQMIKDSNLAVVLEAREKEVIQ